MKTKQIIRYVVIMAIWTAIALVLHVLEAMIPTLIPIPGIKIGLPNLVTLILLLKAKPKDAFLVLFLRIILAFAIGGNVVNLAYSLCGGICSFLVMLLIQKLTSKHWPLLISMFGSIAHVCGQIVIAFILVRTISILSYLPYLLISAILMGGLIGLLSMWTIYLLDRTKTQYYP